MTRSALIAATLLAAAPWCQAQQGWAHLGVAHVSFNESATVDVAAFGGRVPGQSATASNNTTVGVEVGWEVSKDVIASLTLGLPPTTTLTGKGGPLDGAKLGEVKYGPSVWSLHWHFDAGAVKPYVGGGLTYVLALDSKDATLTGVKVKNALGGALQAGFDAPMGKDWGLFVDVKRLFVKAKATFNGPAPGEAKVTLDPWILHAGVSLRF